MPADPRRRHGLGATIAGPGLAVALWLGVTATAALAQPAVPRYAEHQDLGYVLDDRGDKTPIRTPAEWHRRRDHILANMQAVMGEVPPESRRVPLAVEILAETNIADVPGLRRRKISYQTEPTTRVQAYLFLPGGEPGGARATEAAGRRPAVLCLHQTTKIGKEEPAGLGGKPNLHYALHLARRGYVTLAPDYPSFGDHAYDFQAADSPASGTMKAIWDNMRAIDLLQSLPEVDGERIGCIGHSLGGHNALFTAAFEPRITAVVSNCGFTRFHKDDNANLRAWASDRYMPRIHTVYHDDPDRVPFDFTEIVAALAPRPFLASAPERDSDFDVSGVQDCIAAARPVYALFGAADSLRANYPDSAHDFPEDAREVAYRFFDEHLGQPRR
jgi:dienelactone hydrolase